MFDHISTNIGSKGLFTEINEITQRVKGLVGAFHGILPQVTKSLPS
jgi:hypothetical protein